MTVKQLLTDPQFRSQDGVLIESAWEAYNKASDEYEGGFIPDDELDNVELITLPKIKPEEVEVYYEGNSIGFCNEYEFNELRIQIKKSKLDGYAVMHEGQLHHLRNDGHFYWNWPENLFDLLSKQLREIHSLWQFSFDKDQISDKI